MEKSRKIILGIDPGTLLMGYCIIHVEGQAIQMKEMNVLRLHSRLDNYTRLQHIYNKVDELIRLFRPNCFAIEAPFFGKNVQSMLKLGRAQGVAIAAAIGAGVQVCEYSPRKIKQSITGNGNADKEQVWKMLQQIIAIEDATIKYLDASDALAVAVCHHFQDNTILNGRSTKATSWKQFIEKNPQRLRVK
ncbi:MAG: crossover junction endodeoxyribonuclease RuvC [Chitinophagaceae bacterium]|nr:crossover junction endodeoxyribonuclease RuvC [Chitinophagaceae bacterium]